MAMGREGRRHPSVTLPTVNRDTKEVSWPEGAECGEERKELELEDYGKWVIQSRIAGIWF
jgi:hypothetical protein